MKEKINILALSKVKTKVKKGMLTMQDYIDQYAPDTYTYREAYTENAIEEVRALRPEIIWIAQDVSMDCLELIKDIKSVHPAVAIFIMFIGEFDDEQEVADTYLELGVYKCYFIPPLVLDTLVHDMYVALNLE